MKRLTFITFLFLLLIINHILYNLFPEEKSLLYYFIGFSFVFQILIPLIKIIQKRSDIFEPFILFLFLFQFFYFVHPIQIILFNPTIWITKDLFDVKIAVKMFHYINVALISFYSGYFLLKGVAKENNNFEDFSLTRDEIITGKFISIIFVIIGFFAFFLIIKDNFVFYISHLELRALSIRGHGILVFVAHLTPVGIFGYFHFSMSGKKKLKPGLMFLTSMFLLLYLFEGSRGRVFITILALILFYNYKIREIKINRIIAFSIIIFLLFWVFAGFRASGDFDDMNRERNRPLINKMITKMFYSTEHFVVTISEPPEKKLYGRSYLQPVLVWIPGIFWEKKPVAGIGTIYTNHYFPGKKAGGVSFGPGIIGGPLMNFGPAGICLELFLLGLLLKFIYIRFLRREKDRYLSEMFYFLSLPVIIFISVSRTITTSFTMLPFFLIPLGLLFLSCKILLFIIQKKNSNSGYFR